MKPPRLRLIQIGTNWWIVGLEKPMGPYSRKEDAESDRRGVIDFYKHEVDKEVMGCFQ
ncbi:hypothetical protein LCGC14_0249750 [marine sediment metagenome]|uniref:Uncharacterized protein n=1 Tax=marine sediment metagenome TaxID=412755 RepID=A0A0F9ULS8_9ZZZZ